MENIKTITHFSRENDCFEVMFIESGKGALFEWRIPADKYRLINARAFDKVAEQAIKEVEASGGVEKFRGVGMDVGHMEKTSYANT